MAFYKYQNKAGEVIEREFPFGQAPHSVGKYVRVMEFPMLVTFNGPGFTKKQIGFKENRVTWDETLKIMEQADKNAKENTKKQVNALKTAALEYL